MESHLLDHDDAFARRVAHSVAPTFVTIARRVVDLAEIAPGHTVLDVHTGTGIAAFLAVERAGREGSVIGMDSSPALLTIARERSAAVGYEHILWQEGNAAALTYATDSFDAVLCMHGLVRVPNPLSVLDEFRRVLVEGGRVALSSWSTRASNEWQGFLDAAVRTTGHQLSVASGPAQPGNIEALLQSAGFIDVEAVRLPDVLRFPGVAAFWDWVTALPPWAEAIAALPAAAQARTSEALLALLAPRERGGELVLGRETVYARAVAPESF